jgi:hypothetical protein
VSCLRGLGFNIESDEQSMLSTVLNNSLGLVAEQHLTALEVAKGDETWK